MKHLLILSLISFSLTAQSQCCPYINSIEVVPSPPVPTDVVKVITTVTTPSQGSFIYSSHTVNGNTIDVEACYLSGLLPATQTFYDTLEIGFLNPGIYTVNFTAYQSSDTICNHTDTTTATSTFEVIELAAGFEPVSNQLGEIYPNPSNGSFSIQLPTETQVTRMRIRSISGEIIEEMDFREELNLSLAGGMYLIEFMSNNTLIGYQRFLIN